MSVSSCVIGRAAAAIAVVSLALVTGPPTLVAQDEGNGFLSPVAMGSVVGAGAGVAAGVLFVDEACDEDSCVGGTKVLGGVVGALFMGTMGGFIGSRLDGPRAGRKSAALGTAIGSLLGGAGGVALVAATCEPDACGPAAYASIGMAGAGLGGALGALIGGLGGGRGSSSARVENRAVGPVVQASRGRVRVGVRISG